VDEDAEVVEEARQERLLGGAPPTSMTSRRDVTATPMEWVQNAL
jgi:hypothetical protein